MTEPPEQVDKRLMANKILNDLLKQIQIKYKSIHAMQKQKQKSK